MFVKIHVTCINEKAWPLKWSHRLLNQERRAQYTWMHICKWMGECLEVLMVIILIKHCVYLCMLDYVPLCNITIVQMRFSKLFTGRRCLSWGLFTSEDIDLTSYQCRYWSCGPFWVEKSDEWMSSTQTQPSPRLWKPLLWWKWKCPGIWMFCLKVLC